MCEGPWLPGPATNLIDMSMIGTSGGNTVLYGLTQGGNVLRREGITPFSPLGETWTEIAAPVPMVSISCSENFLWAVGVYGSVYVRDVKRDPSSIPWFQIDYPSDQGGDKLKRVGVSSGGKSVWAIDSQRRLWFRANSVREVPEGTDWLLASENVYGISVGATDEDVYGIIKSPHVGGGLESGQVAKRIGICASNLKGDAWQTGLFAAYVCARGL